MCSEVKFMINVSGKIENNKKKNIIEKINNTAVDLYMESKCENKL